MGSVADMSLECGGGCRIFRFGGGKFLMGGGKILLGPGIRVRRCLAHGEWLESRGHRGDGWDAMGDRGRYILRQNLVELIQW